MILKAFNLVSKKKITGETIIELSFKTLINIIEREPQYLEQFDGIRDLLAIIQLHYKDFQPLGRQLAMRFTYLITKQWSKD